MRNLVKSQTAVRLKKLQAELRHVAHKPKDADAIHDLRVAIRRLRQELKVFEAWFDPDKVQGVRRRSRKLLERCAAVRNCDIAIEVLREANYPKPELIEALEKERRQMREALGRKLASWRRRDRIRKWRGDLRVRHSPAGAGEKAQALLPALIEDLFRAGGEAARPDSSHQRMHQFRLMAKRFRYTLELFEKVYEGKTKEIMELLKTLQEKLGAINDCAATLQMIRQDQDAGAAVLRLAGEREAEFRTYWKKHFGPRKRAQWRAVLGAADEKN